MLTRPIPSSGEQIPVIGLGSWKQFDVCSSESELKPLREVLTLMSEAGATVIDSSPMYGNSEKVIGDLTSELRIADKFFYATKVWTNGKHEGIEQMEFSMKKMRRNKIDLMQIHNLVDWQIHIQTLNKWKEENIIRYTGITHYTDSSHEQLEQIIKSEQLDFVQFNYSIASRNAEKSLLETSKDNNVAVIINEPFEKGSLFKIVKGKELPAFALENDIKNWTQFFLKYILSNESVTCIIPGTSDAKHLADNISAGYGRLPDEKLRRMMVEYFEKL